MWTCTDRRRRHSTQRHTWRAAPVTRLSEASETQNDTCVSENIGKAALRKGSRRTDF